MVKGVIFDMDGVLVDNSHMHIETFCRWYASKGIDFPPEKVNSFFGMGNSDIFRSVMGLDITDEQVLEYAEEKEQLYRDLYSPTIKPLAGLISLLQDLRAKGIKIAVGSSAMRKNVDFVLDECGIRPYFDAISDGDMVAKAKPDPSIFLLAAELMNLKPEECLVFEDSFAGVEAARRAGMKVVAVATSFPKAQHKDYDAIIDDFSETSAQEIISI